MNQKMDRYQTILNWLDKEKKKDKVQLEKSKMDFIEQIKKINKSEIFEPKKPKLTLWQKIKMIILGH